MSRSLLLSCASVSRTGRSLVLPRSSRSASLNSKTRLSPRFNQMPPLARKRRTCSAMISSSLHAASPWRTHYRAYSTAASALMRAAVASRHAASALVARVASRSRWACMSARRMDALMRSAAA